MGAPGTPGSWDGGQPAGLDDPGLPDFAAFCAARERFFRGLAEPAVMAEPDASPRRARRDGSDEAPVAARPSA